MAGPRGNNDLRQLNAFPLGFPQVLFHHGLEAVDFLQYLQLNVLYIHSVRFLNGLTAPKVPG